MVDLNLSPSRVWTANLPLHTEFIRLARRLITTKLKMSQRSTTRLVTIMPYMPTAT
jgi:hypothetical protein